MVIRLGLFGLLALSLAACSSVSSGPPQSESSPALYDGDAVGAQPGESTLWDLFENQDDPNVTLEVNRYIWVAAQEVLDFMPIQAADPFSGVLVLGYGVPPGGSRSYRATIYVQDPALDARSLNIALQTSGGRPASAETVRAVEDAILTRARQLRIRDQGL